MPTEKEFTMSFAQSGKEIEKFTLTEINAEITDNENFFPVAERSSEEQKKITEFRNFIETAEINETLKVEHSSHGNIIYKRVS